MRASRLTKQAVMALAEDDEEGKTTAREMLNKKYNAAVERNEPGAKSLILQVRDYKASEVAR